MPSATAKKAAATKKTAAKKAAAPKQPQQTNLYKVPDGWTYRVEIFGPDSTVVTIGPSMKQSDSFEAHVQVGSEHKGTTTEPTMQAALLTGSRAAKALNDISKKRAALEAAESDALGFLSTENEKASGSVEPKAPAPAPASSGSAPSGLDDVD